MDLDAFFCFVYVCMFMYVYSVGLYSLDGVVCEDSLGRDIRLADREEGQHVELP